MIGWVVLMTLVVIAVAAPRYGVDSRTADSWTADRGERPATGHGPSPVSDVLALGRWVRARFTG